MKPGILNISCKEKGATRFSYVCGKLDLKNTFFYFAPAILRFFISHVAAPAIL